MILNELKHSILEGEAETAYDLTHKALSMGYPAQVILEKGLIAGMNEIADKFRERNVIIPEVLMATRSMHAGLSLLEPYLISSSPNKPGKVIVGTVAGDLHDIGKTLVKTMVMSLRIKVIDLGVDVTPKRFADAVRKEKPEIVMISALLTTTMGVMKSVIEEVRKQSPSVRVFVGGAPVTEEFAKEIAADYYFENAFEIRDYLKENYDKLFLRKD
ncbi:MULTISPECIES: corrinoid protein [Desulfitobacterium]|uniref:Putative cobalamin binding protein n=1 Tax=Desulfitobacterium dehalogenans (strain ATCC 51507 / DSM 9161 / JW/IU-DC1) TaxID=756499 RepID=I4ADC8_DESDJ|nr:MULTISPECIES: corrinoid protein [Desulfitobacterium]AFM01963.1 putative cobalamin binding protein [Desulfitobacterium dehalogenans ATCC 51507]